MRKQLLFSLVLALQRLCDIVNLTVSLSRNKHPCVIRQDFPFSDSEVPFQSNSGGGHVYSNYLGQGLKTFENGFNATTEHLYAIQLVTQKVVFMYVCISHRICCWCSGIMLYA